MRVFGKCFLIQVLFTDSGSEDNNASNKRNFRQRKIKPY